MCLKVCGFNHLIFSLLILFVGRYTPEEEIKKSILLNYFLDFNYFCRIIYIGIIIFLNNNLDMFNYEF